MVELPFDRVESKLLLCLDIEIIVITEMFSARTQMEWGLSLRIIEIEEFQI